MPRGSLLVNRFKTKRRINSKRKQKRETQPVKEISQFSLFLICSKDDVMLGNNRYVRTMYVRNVKASQWTVSVQT